MAGSVWKHLKYNRRDSMNRFLVLIFLTSNLLLGAQRKSSLGVHQQINGIVVPYGINETIQAKHRQLGAVQINPSAAGITISKPGNYILANDLLGDGSTVSGLIIITSSDVELDLNGFLVSNPIGANGAGGVGIAIVGGAGIKNVTVRNGTINACVEYGIQANDVVNLHLDSLLAHGTTTTMGNGHGYLFDTNCADVLINNCRAQHNAGRGFDIAGGSRYEFRQCIASKNTTNGFELRGGTNIVYESCLSVDNTSNGFNFSAGNFITVRDSQATRCVFGLFTSGSTWNNINVEHCEFSSCTTTGLEIEGVTGIQQFALIKDCTAMDNGVVGFAMDSIRFFQLNQLTSLRNSDGIRLVGDILAISVTDCVSSFNTQYGLRLEQSGATPRTTSIRGCDFINNDSDGINIAAAGATNNLTIIFDCNSSSNGGFGIQATASVESVHVGKMVLVQNTSNPSNGTLRITGTGTSDATSPQGWRNIS